MAWKLVWTEDDAGVADGLATLDGATKVVQDPASAQQAAAAGKIPIAMPGGKLAVGWLPAGDASGVAALDASGFVLGAGLVVGGNQLVGAQAGAIADPAGGMVIDAACRATVGQILTALRGHGLIAT